jgi:hypothetical protein
VPLPGRSTRAALRPLAADNGRRCKSLLCCGGHPDHRACTLQTKLAPRAHHSKLSGARGFQLANQGTDTWILQAYLGHHNIQHTVRYAEANALQDPTRNTQGRRRRLSRIRSPIRSARSRRHPKAPRLKESTAFRLELASSAFPDAGNGSAAPVRPETSQLRCDPFARDVAFDPGRATAPRLTVPHMSSSE